MPRHPEGTEVELTPAPLSVETHESMGSEAISTRAPETVRARGSMGSKVSLIAKIVLVGAIGAIALPSLVDSSGEGRGSWIARGLAPRPAVAAPSPVVEAVDVAQPEASQGTAAMDPAEAPAETRTPIAFDRTGHVSVPNGYLVFPPTFQTYDGSYDVLIHFHGNPNVVAESAEVAKLNAVVVMINGAGKGGYEAVYGDRPGTYEDLLAAIDKGLASRGIPNPHARRIALTSWSAGYGAITTILSRRKGTDPLDAIALFDGIHASWESGNSRSFATNGVVQDSSQLTPKLLEARGKGAINAMQMKAFVDAARDATEGKLYFGIAHTEIDPMAYASCTIATDFILGKLGLARHPLDPIDDAPPWVMLKAMETIYDPARLHQLIPLTEVRAGAFHVIGYSGNTPDHHSVQLFEMSQTLLPEIAARWAAPAR